MDPTGVGLVLKVICARKTACSEPVPEFVQLVGLALLDAQEMPPVQTQLENCQPVDGEGRLAEAEKLAPQFVGDWSSMKVIPHAVIDPGEVPVKVEGFV